MTQFVMNAELNVKYRLDLQAINLFYAGNVLIEVTEEDTAAAEKETRLEMIADHPGLIKAGE